jgi:hypothetical protein
MLCPFEKNLEKDSWVRWDERELCVGGGMDSRAFAEWQRETSLPESDL